MGSLVERLSERFRATDVRAPLVADAGGLHAAVAAVLRPSAAGDELLFIKRADRASDPWSGHMAFPGGRRQASDATLLDTAARETLEEVGLDLAAFAHPVVRLPDIAPYTRMPAPLTVTAFVFALDRPAALSLNHEVAAVTWAPLEPLLRGEGATKFRYERDGVGLDFPALALGDNVVWGLTYRMIELLRDAVGSD